MATLCIHDDQENRVPDIRQKQTNVGRKRAVLGVIDSNKAQQNIQIIKTKQPLGVQNCNVSQKDQENVSNRENRKNLVNPVVPVAQFEAFKVYEDTTMEERRAKIDAKLKMKTSSNQVYTGTEERFLTKTEAAEILKQRKEKEEAERPKVRPEDVELEICPMSIEKNENEVLAEEVILKTGQKKDVFFEMEEYRDDIFKYLREHEMKNRPKPGYMKKQPDVTPNMRTILVDWLVEVAEEYKLQCETLYLAVNFIDRFLSYMSVVRAKLQLVGTAAMFLASKYEEIYPPDIGEFVYITDDTYNKRQVIRMEQLILKVLGFDLSIPTPLTFIHAICVSTRLTEKTLYLAMYLSELSMLNGDVYLEYLPSMIAASAIALARHTLTEEPWTNELVAYTGYELDDLQKCIEFLNVMFRMAPLHSQHAIQDKYRKQKYLMVSNLRPNIKPIY
ncbi:cyclin-A2 [Aethina tumida]|uniref:cyclin-A2 n=1 Tax=Aethina tumida TaxID=116153 RepID=UPI00096B0057|nr:cyclin-A2 [Aethina tumida]